MKKALKIVGIIFGGFIALMILAVAFSDSDEGPGTKTPAPKVEEVSAPAKEEPKAEEPAAKEETPKEEPKKEEPKKQDNVFAFGTDVPFESGMTVKAVSVTTTTERNQFADPTKYVLVVNLEFTNTTAAEISVTSHELNVQDNSGFQGEAYPGGDQMVTVAPNGKARAQFQYAIDGEAPYKVLCGEAIWQK